MTIVDQRFDGRTDPTSRTHDLIVEAARVVANARLDLTFRDAGDAFTSWLAYYRVLGQARQLAARLIGSSHPRSVESSRVVYDGPE